MQSPSAMLIRLPQRFGIDEARALNMELDLRLLCDQPCVILDLSSVKQIDAAGLDMLLRSMVKIARQDGAVQLGDVSPEAATILELMRMDGIFQMFPSIREDIATVRIVPAQAVIEETEEETRAEEPQPLAA